jgi:hypothetical protein
MGNEIRVTREQFLATREVFARHRQARRAAMNAVATAQPVPSLPATAPTAVTNISWIQALKAKVTAWLKKLPWLLGINRS